VHAQDIKEIEQCPPSQRLDNLYGTPVYRFVRTPKVDSQCFLTPMQIKPTRKLDTSHEMCSAHALSFFTTLESIKKKRDSFRKSANKNLIKSIGDKIAECIISINDGHACSLRNDGHFDLHPYETLQIHNSANMIDETE
jgi:hypothetical protein